MHQNIAKCAKTVQSAHPGRSWYYSSAVGRQNGAIGQSVVQYVKGWFRAWKMSCEVGFWFSGWIWDTPKCAKRQPSASVVHLVSCLTQLFRGQVIRGYRIKGVLGFKVRLKIDGGICKGWNGNWIRCVRMVKWVSKHAVWFLGCRACHQGMHMQQDNEDE